MIKNLIKNLIITGIEGQDGKILVEKLKKEEQFNVFGFSKKIICSKLYKKIQILNFLNNKKKLNNFFKNNSRK